MKKLYNRMFVLSVLQFVIIFVAVSCSDIGNIEDQIGDSNSPEGGEWDVTKPVKSASAIPGNSGKSNERFALSDELLIRLSQDAQKQVVIRNGQIDPKRTGLPKVNQLNHRFEAVGMERVAVIGTNSDITHKLFRWYRIRLRSQPGVPEYIGEKTHQNTPAMKRLNNLLGRLQRMGEVEKAELNYQVMLVRDPDDPYYYSQGSWGQSYADLWGIHRINAAAAWDLTTGSVDIVVADIDTGVDYNHPELVGNIWKNPLEIEGNGIDDDKNGYVDDVLGWDWSNGDNDPMDDHGHGTHTVGTIAATGNNGLGVVGVNWNSKIMSLKFLSSGGSGSLYGGVKAIQYAADMGARVSSNSWGARGRYAITEDAVNYAHDKGMVTVAAAGNSNADALGFSPAGAELAVTVAATDYTDSRAYFSNYGSKIDVGAPGVDILSLQAAVSPMCTNRPERMVGDLYCRVSGTSMAAPHVAGLAALILARNPSLTNEQVRQLLRVGSEDLGLPGQDKDFGFGRIDAAGSVALSQTLPLVPKITSPTSRNIINGILPVYGGIEGSDFASYTLQIGEGRMPSEWTTVLSSTNQVSDGLLGDIDTSQFSDGLYLLRLIAENRSGLMFYTLVYDLTIDNFDLELVSPKLLVGHGIIDVRATIALKHDTLELDNYQLQWKNLITSSPWTDEGITLKNTDPVQVVNEVIATWDTTALSNEGYYQIKLVATTTTGVSVETSNSLSKDSTIVAGWPVVLRRQVPLYQAITEPTLADINGDSILEVVLIEHPNVVHVLDRSGTELPGFPVTLPLPPNTFQHQVSYAPNVVDVTGDNLKEILINLDWQVAPGDEDDGVGKEWDTVFIVQSDGKLLPSWPEMKFYNHWGEKTDKTPITADLDNDGQVELIFCSRDGYVHAFHTDGSELAGFPVLLPDGHGERSIISADLDRDGLPELILTARTADHRYLLYVLNHRGQVMAGWPFQFPVSYKDTILFPNYGAPAVGDIDGDGVLEVIIMTYAYNHDNLLYVFGIDGKVREHYPATWVHPSYYSNFHSPTAADLDGDGKDEIIAGNGYIRIFGDTGLKRILDTNFYSSAAVGLADINGDGLLNLIASSIPQPQVIIIDQAGQEYWSPSPMAPTNYSNVAPATVADLDGNGKAEVAKAMLTMESVVVCLWEIPTTHGNATGAWPTYGGNSQRNGYLDTSTPLPPDTQAPSASIIEPQNNQTISGIIPVKVGASDNRGVIRAELYVNSILSGSDPSFPYEFSLDTNTLSNGLHMLQAKAYDAAGNVGASPTITVVVENEIPDTTPPTVALTSPQDGDTVSGAITISAVASDNVAVSKVDFYVNGSLVDTDTSAPYSMNWDTIPYADGPYSISAKAYDAAGNVGASPTITVVVENEIPDTTPPTVALTSPQDGDTISGAITISAVASDNVAVSKVDFFVNGSLVDTDNSAPYSMNWDTIPYADGPYSISAKAYDTSSNSATSQAVSVIVHNRPEDTIPPTAPTDFTATKNRLSKGRRVVVCSWGAASDNVAVDHYEVYRDSILVGQTATTQFEDYSPKNGNYYAVAVDTSGNRSQPSNKVLIGKGGRKKR